MEKSGLVQFVSGVKNEIDMEAEFTEQIREIQKKSNVINKGFGGFLRENRNLDRISKMSSNVYLPDTKAESDQDTS